MLLDVLHRDKSSIVQLNMKNKPEVLSTIFDHLPATDVKISLKLEVK